MSGISSQTPLDRPLPPPGPPAPPTFKNAPWSKLLWRHKWTILVPVTLFGLMYDDYRRTQRDKAYLQSLGISPSSYVQRPQKAAANAFAP
ncbi:hypothetical protein RvY_11464 [Ramazzottius varieornatus]|uniref:Uncharacterized protein n=1 Tax=Ramazzottius varieornatus TaxID=947166 RepID=A0A1D1VKJ0_RAMVA|nr:hypothetical protein RvY_11464 [Ramazzottius varieornatus]